jgi:branched-chain amino acid transport system substrate-binding protein
MLRIGILTPRSTLYPTMGFDILSGLKIGFAKYNISNEITLVTENIGFGTDEPEIYTKAEKMLLGENADVVIVCCDSRIAAMLQSLFTAAGKLLLVVNMGANLPEGWQAEPTTITHSLNFCFCASLTGKLAAVNQSGALVASFYDAGYNQVFSMVTRFQQQNSKILYNHVTHLKPENFTLLPLQQFLASEPQVQSLLCLFSADMAELFYKEMPALQQNHHCDIFVSPMLLEEALINSIKNNSSIKNVQGYTPWKIELSNNNNKQFITAYESAENKKPNVFALLGWDTALIIDSFYQQLKANNNNTAKAVEAMHTQPILPSPRGWIKLDAATNHIYGPAWLVNTNNNFEITIQEDNPLNIDEEWKSYKDEIFLAPTELHSAWRNTYLCI